MGIEKIECGDFFALINSDRGANCIELVNKKYNASILRVPEYNNLDNPYLYGMPILFPVNRISGGSFLFEGRRYEYPINEPATNCTLHGTLHETEFEISEKQDNRIVCIYKSAKKNPYPNFPHEFEIETEYEIFDEGLRQKTTVRNLSDKNMPNMLGFHTTFNTPFIKGGEMKDIRIYAELSEEYERDMMNYLPTGTILSCDDVTDSFNKGTYIPNEKISRHYRAEGSGIMSIEDIKNKLKIVYTNDDKMLFRLIYGEGNGFICLEAQNCMANSPNSPFDRNFAGFDYIPPNEEKVYCSKIELREV